MNIPSIEVLIKKIKTRKENDLLAEELLTKTMLDKLGPKPKIVDIQRVIVTRAASNIRVGEKLQKWLYDEVEVTGKHVQELLGINVGLRNKLVDQKILVPTEAVNNRNGNGVILLFTYTDVLKCVDSDKYKELKAKYDTNHDKNVASAKKAVVTKAIQIEQMVDDFGVKVTKVNPTSLYRSALTSKAEFKQMMDLEYGSETSTYEDLDTAPDEHRNRWVDNYIRHELTNYDDVDEYLKGKSGKNAMYSKYLPEKMTKEIRKIYPFYKQGTYVAIYRNK